MPRGVYVDRADAVCPCGMPLAHPCAKQIGIYCSWGCRESYMAGREPRPWLARCLGPDCQNLVIARRNFYCSADCQKAGVRVRRRGGGRELTHRHDGICPNCGERPREQDNRRLRPWCKECDREAARQRMKNAYVSDPDVRARTRARVKAWNKANPDKARVQAVRHRAKYYAKNREAILARRRARLQERRSP